MWVNKIVYITPGEYHRGELSSVAESQLRKVLSNVLEWAMWDSTKVFRTTVEKAPMTGDTLLYLSNKSRKTSENISENLYSNLLSSPDNIDAIINSTKEWEVVVVGVTQKELKDILDWLKENWYNVVDKEKIHNIYDIHAITIDLNNKTNSSFFQAAYGQ